MLLKIKTIFNILNVKLLNLLPCCSRCTPRAMGFCTAQHLSLHLLVLKGVDKQYSYPLVFKPG